MEIILIFMTVGLAALSVFSVYHWWRCPHSNPDPQLEDPQLEMVAVWVNMTVCLCVTCLVGIMTAGVLYFEADQLRSVNVATGGLIILAALNRIASYLAPRKGLSAFGWASSKFWQWVRLYSLPVKEYS